MTKKAPIDAVNVIHKALEHLDLESQLKALRAAVTLLGIMPERIGLTYIPRISDAISRQFPRPSLSPSAGSRFLGGGKVFLR